MTNIPYVYTLYYLRPDGPDKKIRLQETIVATSWHEAQRYWYLEFYDEGIEIEQMTRHEPVIAMPPLPLRSFPQQPAQQDAAEQN